MKIALCMNDLSTVGRSSLAVVSPVLSAMGVQCCPLPTVVLSSHTGGFDPVVRADQTEFFGRALEAYRAQELRFDCLATGYLASCEEAALAARYLAENPTALRLTDPVMADGGRLYSGFDDAMVQALRDLCAQADIITPNPTESALLLGLAADDITFTPHTLEQRCRQLGERFDTDVLLTGAALADGRIHCGGYEKKYRRFFTLQCNYADAAYPGTGDLFAAVLAGALLSGNALASAAQLALFFTQKAAHATFAKKTDPRFGVEFEPLLPELEATLCR